MKNLFSFLIVAIFLIAVSSADLKGEEIAETGSNFDISDVNFEPIQQGKNVVYVNVKNKSDKKQIFAIHIYTRSPDYGKQGIGWGTGFFNVLEPNEIKQLRFVYKIQGPVTDNTWLKLGFRNPESVEKRGSIKPFREKRYSIGELKRSKTVNVALKPVSTEKLNQLSKILKIIQNHIQNKEYEQAWQFFSDDYKNAEFQALGVEGLKKRMEPVNPIDSAFYWEKQDFLKLSPIATFEKDSKFVLTAATGNQTWTIDFVEENGQWKVDWIAGYLLRILGWQDWENRLLPTMQKNSTAHFDIYYFEDSTAEREINNITKEKEKGFQEICQFLGKASDVRIRIVFFEDEKTKHQETGHQGRGWAYGNTIVEVYNEKEKLDPYHETVHILMGPYGNPPSLFNEGFAVYMAERLGVHALEYLGGGNLSSYQRARELKSKSDWIGLKELITYTEIGSLESKPPVAYAEAASFVKFLIDAYGRDKFLEAYKTLRNSDDKAVQQQNIKLLEQVYGRALEQLEKQWEDTFLN